MTATESTGQKTKRRKSAKTNGDEPATSDQPLEAPLERSREIVPVVEPPPQKMPADRQAIELEIREQAYEIFLSRGGTAGDDLLDWLEAERIVLFRRGLGG